MATETKTSMPSWLTGPSKDAVGDVQDWLGSSKNYVYGTKKGEDLFTGMNGMQKKSIGNVNWLANQDLGKMFGLNDAAKQWKQYSGADLKNGKVGSVKSFMNPYTSQVLDPTIREIQQESERQANNIGSQAASAGAFGDARHGIAEGQNMEMTNQAVSDATNRAYSDAYNAGNAQRNTAIERLGTGAQGLQGVGDNLFGKMNDVNDSLYNAGNIAYNFDEKKRQTMQAFQEALKGKKYNDAMTLLQTLNGTSKGDTTSSTSSDNGMWGLAGSLLGGLF
jgi:hypothetical protein